MRKLPNVAAIAIAKDEAPYLHEWIHHCTYFGFSHIFIGINRTTDTSWDILEKIQKQIPNLIVETIDGLDKPNSRIQDKAYMYFLEKVYKEYPEVDFIFPHDIDEFWFPKNFSTKISKYVSDRNNPDLISFRWLQESAADKPFSAPFENFCYCFGGEIKTIYRTSLFDIVNASGAHAPELDLDHVSNIIWLDGADQQIEITRQRLIRRNIKEISEIEENNAFIFHRCFRSEDEYFCSLNRGFITPLDSTDPKSRNAINVRRSKLLFTKQRVKKPDIIIPDENLQSYLCSLENFIQKTVIQDKWGKAQALKLSTKDDFNLAKGDKNIRYFYEHYLFGLCDTRLEGDLLIRLHKICKQSPEFIKMLHRSARKIEKTNPASATRIYSMIKAFPCHLKIAGYIIYYGKKIFCRPSRKTIRS